MARPHHEPHLPPPPLHPPVAGAARPRAAIVAQARAGNHQRAATAPALMAAGAGIHDSAPELRVLPQMPIQGHSASTVAAENQVTTSKQRSFCGLLPKSHRTTPEAVVLFASR